MPVPSEEALSKLSYKELLRKKNQIISYITAFENDFNIDKLAWDERPSPDVHYQYYLRYLGIIGPLLSKAFNREYESGEQHIEDYYADMRKIQENMLIKSPDDSFCY